MSGGGYEVREPMRLLEAEAWVIAKLGTTPRAEHSRFVGALLRAMAARLAHPYLDGTPRPQPADHFAIGRHRRFGAGCG